MKRLIWSHLSLTHKVPKVTKVNKVTFIKRKLLSVYFQNVSLGKSKLRLYMRRLSYFLVVQQRFDEI